MKISPTRVLLPLLLAAASVVHGGKPVTSKVTIKGLGVHGYAGVYDATTCLSTELSLEAHNDVTRSDGSSTPTKYAFVNAVWTNFCTGAYSYARIEIPAPSLTGSLKYGATVQAAFTEARKCTYDRDLDDFLCELVPLEGSLSASFTPVGSSYKERFLTQSAFVGIRTKGRYFGTNVDANVTFDGTILDGVPFLAGVSDGYIHKTTTGSMEMVTPS